MKQQQEHDLNETYEKGNGTVKVTLKGDGTSAPLLKVKLFREEANCYVDAGDLRLMAKQFKKWAKALEQVVD